MSSCPRSGTTLSSTIPTVLSVLSSTSSSVDNWRHEIIDETLSNEKQFSLFNYLSHDMWIQFGDPRIQQFPLFTSGPWSVMAIVGVYLMFVTIIGPNYMRNRKPFDLKRFVLYYNVAMVTLNGYMFIHGMYLTNFGRDAWGCQTVEKTLKEENVERIKLATGYLFFLSKIIELIDTVIFVLRKKSNQITLLHVIHHSLVPILMWIGFKVSPGGNAVFFPLVNALIHTIMYTYYALSTLGPSVRPYLWWKKYLTRIQMVQFVAVIIHSLHVLFIPSCNFPKMLLYLAVSNAFLFLVLFYSFYVHTYKAIEHKNKARILITTNSNGDAKYRDDANFDKDADNVMSNSRSIKCNGDARKVFISKRTTPMTSQIATMCFPELNNNQGDEEKEN